MGEELPTEIQRAVQPGILSPIEMTDMLPGAGIYPGLPVKHPEIEEINSELTQHEELVGELMQGVITSLVDSLHVVTSNTNELVAHIIGDLENEYSKCEGVCKTISKKLLDTIDNRLYSIYGKISEMGFQLPNHDQIKYGVATGDAMGSLEYAPGMPAEPILEVNQGDTVFGLDGGGDGGWTIPDQPTCPKFNTNSDWVQWCIHNNYTTWDDATKCLPRTPDGFPVVPNGQILVNKLGQCPAGYVETAWPPEGGGPVVACAKVGGSDGTNCALTPNAAECYSYTPPDCPYGPQWYPLQQSYQNDIKETINGIGYKSPWTKEDYGEPDGVYRRCTITYKTHDTGGTTVLHLNVPDGKKIFLCNYTLLYGDSIPAGCREPSCLVCRDTYTVGSTTTTGPSCPILPPPPCDVKPGTGFPKIKTNVDDVCAYLDEIAKMFNVGDFKLSNYLGMSTNGEKSSGTAGTLIKAIMGSDGPVLPDLLNRFKIWLDKLITDLSKTLDCDAIAASPLMLYQSCLTLLNQYIPVVPKQLLTNVAYAVNTACQSIMPNCADANKAWLANTISEATWLCWTKLNGVHPKEASLVREAGRTKVDALQASQLYRRKFIDQAEYKELLRQNGVVQDRDAQNIYDYTQAFPGVSDTIRMMVRDAADPDVVTEYELDKDFDKKYNGKVKDFFDALGLDEETAKYYWRIHWQYPSYTQVKEMVRRLRPGAVGIENSITEADFRYLLQTNDFAPRWIDAMVATSYRVPTRQDAVNMFMLHQINGETFNHMLQDVGYTFDDANKLLDLYDKKRSIRDVQRAGYPTAKQLVRQYAHCLITEDMFKRTMKLIAEDNDQMDESENAASMMRNVYLRELTIKTITKEMRLGIIDEATATQKLAEQHIDPQCVPDIIANIKKRQAVQSKYLSASQLCKMRQYNIITAEEQLNALIRTHWLPSDAMRITQECTAEMAEKAAKKAAADAKKAQAAAKAAEKENAKNQSDKSSGPVPSRNGSQTAI